MGEGIGFGEKDSKLSSSTWIRGTPFLAWSDMLMGFIYSSDAVSDFPW